MGVIVNKNNQIDNELTRRINADLRAKAMSGVGDGADDTEAETPDFAENTEYVKNLKKTSKFGWVWIVLVILAIVSIISIVMI